MIHTSYIIGFHGRLLLRVPRIVPFLIVFELLSCHSKTWYHVVYIFLMSFLLRLLVITIFNWTWWFILTQRSPAAISSEIGWACTWYKVYSIRKNQQENRNSENESKPRHFNGFLLICGTLCTQDTPHVCQIRSEQKKSINHPQKSGFIENSSKGIILTLAIIRCATNKVSERLTCLFSIVLSNFKSGTATQWIESWVCCVVCTEHLPRPICYSKSSIPCLYSV